jgi:hypothetical protein
MSIQFSKIFPGCEVVSVQGKPYLFSNIRLDRESVPEGMFIYDVRDDDCDGQFWEIQRFVMVNHWCTIVGKEPLALDEHGQYWCMPQEDDPDTSSEGWFLSTHVDSVEEYIEKYDELKEEAA